jgi:hypothetical protein
MKRWTEWSSVHCVDRVLARSWGSRAYYSCAGESWAYLRDLDPRLLTLLSSDYKDDEAVDLGHSVSLPARLGNGDVVFLADLYRLGSLRPEASAGTRSPETASASVTQYFISQCVDDTDPPDNHTL